MYYVIHSGKVSVNIHGDEYIPLIQLKLDYHKGSLIAELLSERELPKETDFWKRIRNQQKKLIKIILKHYSQGEGTYNKKGEHTYKPGE